MSKLLINDPPLVVQPSLAEKIGLNEAIFVQQLHWMLGRDSAIVKDGQTWVQCTAEKFQLRFKFWSLRTVERLISNLRRDGLIETKRTQHGNLIRLDLEAFRRLDQLDPDNESGPNPTVLRVGPDSLAEPRVRERSEEGTTEETTGETLFQLESEPASETVDKEQKIWDFWESTFPGANRGGLTAARRRDLTKALAAVEGDMDACLDAIRGFAQYLQRNPDKPQRKELSRVFTTGPTDRKNLTDKIYGWAQDAEKRTSTLEAIAHVPRGYQGGVREMMNDIAYKMRKGYDLHDADNDGLSYLATQWGLVPSLVDGKVQWNVNGDLMDQERRARYNV